MWTVESTVFVVQERRRLDIRAAAEFGHVVPLLAESEQMYDMNSAVRRIFTKLHHFTEHDYILPIGHPTAIAVAVALACRLNAGRAKLLVWDSTLGGYTSTQIDIGDIPPNEQVRL